MDNKTGKDKKARLTVALLGALTGFINGLFGSGGGVIAIFGMQKTANVSTHKSHATAIAVILPISIVSLVVYLKNGLPDLGILLWVSAGGVLGGLIGAKLLKNIKSPMLHGIFGVFMIIAAVKMIF